MSPGTVFAIFSTCVLHASEFHFFKKIFKHKLFFDSSIPDFFLRNRGQSKYRLRVFVRIISFILGNCSLTFRSTSTCCWKSDTVIHPFAIFLKQIWDCQLILLPLKSNSFRPIQQAQLSPCILAKTVMNDGTAQSLLIFLGSVLVNFFFGALVPFQTKQLLSYFKRWQ